MGKIYFTVLIKYTFHMLFNIKKGGFKGFA